MNVTKLVPIIIASMLVLAGCTDSPGGPSPYTVSNFGTPDSPELVPLEAGYKIAPMDTVSVKVFKMPDLSGDYEVDLAGHISMPLIGEVESLVSAGIASPWSTGCSGGTGSDWRTGTVPRTC